MLSFDMRKLDVRDADLTLHLGAAIADLRSTSLSRLEFLARVAVSEYEFNDSTERPFRLGGNITEELMRRVLPGLKVIHFSGSQYKPWNLDREYFLSHGDLFGDTESQVYPT